jgi:hypothetical protein
LKGTGFNRPSTNRCLLIAAVALLAGCRSPEHPPAAPTGSAPSAASHPLFRDVAKAGGLNFRLGHANLEYLNILETSGHGCAFLDYDGDGRLDILLVGNAGARLYRNQGDGTFADVTDRALPKPPANAHFLGCAVADYDGDGRPDIFLTGYGSTALYHNEGNGSFRDVTAGSGLEARGPYDWTTSAAWADVDGDGRLDLYVCRYLRFTPESKQLCGYKALDGSAMQMSCNPGAYSPEQGSLYRNEGGGRFTDITQAAGMGDTHGNALGCLFCDFNADGKPDLYIANDAKPADLYLNLGKGRFRNIAVESGTAFGADGLPMSGMGVDWGDYDNDGRFDLLVANYAGQPKSLYHSEGRNLFVNSIYQSGLGAPSLRPLAFGAAFIDYDNDGLLDIVFTNGHVQSLVEKVDSTTSYKQSTQLFHNLGKGRFTDVSAEAGPDFLRKIVGRGIAVGDYDGDGRPDLLVVDEEGAPLLLHNESASHHHWLTLRCLRSPGGPDAVGARITVSAGGHSQVAEVRAGGSYLSANAPEVHFGLGSATRADTVTIRWPDGHTTTLRSVAADHLYRVTPTAAAPAR